MDEVPTRYKAPAHAFPSTCWSLIGDASVKGGKEADLDALQTFCVSYWYPLYAWVRQSGVKADEAQDLIQGFFERLIEKDFLAAAEEGKGRMRSFLIVCLKRHVRDVREHNRAEKRDFHKTVLLDFEWADAQFSKHSDREATPDAMYDQRWAHALVLYSLNLLKESMEANGKGDLFAELRPYLEFRSDEEESYATLASRLGISETAIRSRVHRMRKEYKRILLEQVRMTLEEGEDPQQELMALLGAV